MLQSLGSICLYLMTSAHLASTLFTLDNRQYRYYEKPNMDISPASDKSNRIIQQMFHPYDDREFGFVSDPLRFEKKHAISKEVFPSGVEEKRKSFKRGEFTYHLPLDTGEEEHIDYERHNKEQWKEEVTALYKPSSIYPVLRTIEREHLSQPELLKLYANKQVPSYEKGRFIFNTPRPFFNIRSNRFEQVPDSEDKSYRYLNQVNVPSTYRSTTTTTHSPLQVKYPIEASVGENFIPISAYFDNYAQIGSPKHLFYDPWIVENGFRPQYYKTFTADGRLIDHQKQTPEVTRPELSTLNNWSESNNNENDGKLRGNEGISHYIPSLTTNPHQSEEVIGRLISLKERHYTDEQEDTTAPLDDQNYSDSPLYPKLSQILEKDIPKEPCSARDDGDYEIDDEVLEMFPGTDPQCNFIKCANNNVYVYPCGIGSRNQANGKGHDDYGFCGFRDSEQHCGVFENRIHNRFVRRL